MFNMKSRHLLNLSVQNALDCLSENFNLKNFPGGACSRNSLEKYATRSSDRRYRVHIATAYYISRSPLSQNPPVAPYLSPGLFIFFSASHSVNCIGLKRYRFSPLFWWGWRTCWNALQITTDRGIRPLSEEVPCIWLYILMFFILHSKTEREIRHADEDLHCWSQLATAWRDNPDRPAQELITTAALLHRSTTNFIPIDHLSAPNVGNLVMGLLSRIYRLREKSWVAKGHELPRVVWGHPPPEVCWNEYAPRCNLVHFETQFWEMLQWHLFHFSLVITFRQIQYSMFLVI